MIQTCTITDWLPDQLANSHLNHWVQRKRQKAAQTMAWSACKHAGWQTVQGKARLTITLVFGVSRRRDTDNLHSRVKGLIDGIVKGGWVKDDSTEWLELQVKSEVQPGRKATVLTLEPLAVGRSDAAEEEEIA